MTRSGPGARRWAATSRAPSGTVEEAAPLAPEAGKEGGEGEAAFLVKINREMAREARRILERLSLHKSLRDV
ncbi:hypothetical protein ACFXAE_32215 [Streptomyces sp. NPDC059454]|uniref:hypothetical protein n=1 Tax=Streptomyces sp. NPDC059454 TaxID=3346836 RepID=UPI0036BD68EF